CFPCARNVSACHVRSCFFLQCTGDHRDLHSFPTRRSSDLGRHRRVREHLRQSIDGFITPATRLFSPSAEPQPGSRKWAVEPMAVAGPRHAHHLSLLWWPGMTLPSTCLAVCLITPSWSGSPCSSADAKALA